MLSTARIASRASALSSMMSTRWAVIAGGTLVRDSAARAGFFAAGSARRTRFPGRRRHCGPARLPPCSSAELAHEGESDTQPPLAAIELALALDEKIEHARQQLGRDADAIVLHVQRRLAAFVSTRGRGWSRRAP
jgi:hypothetical protein